ncbi:MAG: NADAR family protein [Candidatus Heimdallarchaeaceae archaeon]
MNVINSFHGEYKALSNFAAALIQYGGKSYPTVEHGYIAAKSFDIRFQERISKLKSTQVGFAKKLGRQIKLREDWDEARIPIMKKLLVQKFTINNYKKLLLSTGDSELIEGNFWHDNFWGNCICSECKNIEGQNNLGKLLMELREILRV